MIARRAAAILAVIAMCVLAVACAGDAGAGRAGSGVAATAVPGATATAGPSVTTPVTPAPSKETFVYLLGGSSARECIVGNANWADQVERLGGDNIRTYDLGCHNQSFAMDVKLVKAMDAVPTVVFIGLSLGRFTGTPEEAQGQCDDQDASRIIAMGAEVRHLFTESDVLPVGRKQRMLRRWVTERYPLFRQNYAFNVAGLEQLIRECRRRKFLPVLLELPVNFDVVGHAYDGPRARYADDARKLAKRFKAPYLDFVSELKLPNAVFYDLMHLVGPGRAVWQKRLSREIIALLER